MKLSTGIYIVALITVLSGMASLTLGSQEYGYLVWIAGGLLFLGQYTESKIEQPDTEDG